MKKSFVRIQGEGVNMWGINPSHYDDLLRNKRRRGSGSIPAMDSGSGMAAPLSQPSAMHLAPMVNIPIVSLAPYKNPLANPLSVSPAAKTDRNECAASPSRSSNLVPSTPPRKRSLSSSAPKVPRSPRVRTKRPAPLTELSGGAAHKVPATSPTSTSSSSAGPDAATSLRGRSVEEIWLAGQCRSPSPNFSFLRTLAGGTAPGGTTPATTPLLTTVHGEAMAMAMAPGAPLFMPIGHLGSQRALFSTTPDICDQRPMIQHDNWFSLDYQDSSLHH